MAREAYHAYLLRLWRVENDGITWRAHLENVETGEKLGFASLEALMVYLQSLGGETVKPQGIGGGEDDVVGEG